MIAGLKERLAAIPPLIWLLFLVAACLALFAGKAFHIDDTLFLRAAEQIQKHPVDFYGFKMNWYGSTRPMIENFDNPPLACYYIALAAAIFGWSEPVLHLAFIVPALAAAWGTGSLAKHYCGRPVLAAALSVLTPVFLISATTLMCDVILLAFWVWSVVFFEEGLQRGDSRVFLISGLLAGLAFCAKFSGLALVPLLAAYGLCRQRRIGRWLVAPLLPLLFAAGYEWLTHHLYGKGMLLAAATVSSTVTSARGAGFWETQMVGLGFVGGCFIPVLLYAPWLWSGRSMLKLLCVIVPCLLLYPYSARFALLLWRPDGRPDWFLCALSAVLIAGGIHLLLLAATECWKRGDAVSLLLFLWILGIFIFATSVNWTLNGRSLLPMAPAVGILVARRLDRMLPFHPGSSGPVRWLAAPAAAISLVLANADYELAGVGRTAAKDLCANHKPVGRTLWFQGHWGFQYYMEQRGARPLERDFALPVPGDVVIVPAQAVNTFDLATNLVRFVASLEYPLNTHCSTMSVSAGAGFYAATAAPFPFSAGYIDHELYFIFEVTQKLTGSSPAPAGLFVSGAVMQQLERARQARFRPSQTRGPP